MDRPEAVAPQLPARYGLVRVTAVLLAGAAIGYGLYELVGASPRATRPVAALSWLAGVLVVHDVILAPLAVLAGWALSRLLPPRGRQVVGALLFVAACLAMVAIPVLLSPSSIR